MVAFLEGVARHIKICNTVLLLYRIANWLQVKLYKIAYWLQVKLYRIANWLWFKL